MVDADREKISKSKQGQGAYEKPQTAESYIKKYGADVVRLWAASQDFRNDIIVSEERINKVGETYRVIRNALRYQLSNLYDFDPARHRVAEAALTGLDRWILSEFAKLEADVIAAYDACEFHVVYQKISQFAAVELSAIYHDVVKDRLYTDAANSPRRRSTQTTIYRLVTGLCKLLAPILSFTADEAWEFIPGAAGSVHEAVWEAVGLKLGEAEMADWQEWMALREFLLPHLEKARQEKRIGKALEAKLTIAGKATKAERWKQGKALLRELMNVSQLELEVESVATPHFMALQPSVAKADGTKCERCWHWETDVGSHPEHPTICGRCVAAVKANLASR
jgi:isoleucyl-tRNA synthetase